MKARATRTTFDLPLTLFDLEFPRLARVLLTPRMRVETERTKFGATLVPTVQYGYP